MRKTAFQIAASVLCALVFTTAPCEARPVVCSSIQAYSALENLKGYSKTEYDTFYGTTDEIYSRVIFSQGPCSLVIASEEKLIALLIQSGKLKEDKAMPFTKAPLLLWSADPNLFMYDIRAITGKRLKSMALPDERLSFAGFASKQVAKRKSFPTGYLKKRLKKVSNEFQAYSLAASKKVQTAFVTKPLIMKDGHTTGSYWLIKREYYPPVKYFIASLSKDDDIETMDLMNYIVSSKNARIIFEKAGFEPLSRK